MAGRGRPRPTLLAGTVAMVVLGCSSLDNGTLPIGAAGAGTPLVEGTLVDADGRPTSGRVVLEGWPAEDVLDAIEVGDVVPTEQLTSVEVGNDGRYLLRLPPDAPMQQLTAGDGIADLEVTAIGDAGHAFYAFSVEVGPGRRLTILDSGLAGELPAQLQLQLEPS